MEKSQGLTLAQQPNICDLLEKAHKSSNKQSLYLDLIRAAGSATALDCLRGTQVSIMRRDDPGKLERALLEAINFVNETLNVSKKLNNFQALDATQTIISEYWFLKIDEIIKAMNNGRTGKYGEIYRLDIQTLCAWIDSYINSEREDALEEKRKLDRPPSPERERLPPEKVKIYTDKIADIVNKIREKKREEKVVLDENYFIESFTNNLPMLSVEELQVWEETLSKEKGMADLLELVKNEIKKRG